MSLNEALVDLATEIAKGGYSHALLEMVAEDHDLNPKLLERKFNEKHGKAPADYVAPKAVEMSEETLLKLARETFDRFAPEGCTPAPNFFGKRFEYENLSYMLVAPFNSHEILCIRTDSGKARKLSSSAGAIRAVHAEIL